MCVHMSVCVCRCVCRCGGQKTVPRILESWSYRWLWTELGSLQEQYILTAEPRRALNNSVQIYKASPKLGTAVHVCSPCIPRPMQEECQEFPTVLGCIRTPCLKITTINKTVTQKNQTWLTQPFQARDMSAVKRLSFSFGFRWLLLFL